MIHKANNIRVELLPKQLDFVADRQSRALLYSGAFGAGKTRALCYRAVSRACQKGAREALVRKHLVTLRATTLRTLLEPDGDLPPVLPPGTYSHNKSEKTIKIRGGGEIIYFGIDDPQKVGSHNLTGAGVDEMVEINEEDFRWLRGRLRGKVNGLNRSIYGACNPGSPSHFLASAFGLTPGTDAHNGYRCIQTNVFENYFLPDDYVDDLRLFTGLARKRYVEGLWVGSEGLVYGEFDRNTMVRQITREQLTGRTVAALDVGYRNPAALIILVGDEDHIHIPFEWYKRKQREEQIREVVKEVYKTWNFETLVVDPSAAALIDALYNDGIPVEPGDNEVFDGIITVQNFVQIQNGKARLTVDPSCVNTIREFETYEWATRPGSGKTEYIDKPVKTNDHAMDAIRYGIREMVSNVGAQAGAW